MTVGKWWSQARHLLRSLVVLRYHERAWLVQKQTYKLRTTSEEVCCSVQLTRNPRSKAYKLKGLHKNGYNVR